jgi:hypothetical protein
MPEFLEEYDFSEKRGRRAQHPYDEWLDGRIQRLVRGTDFQATSSAIRSGIKREAKRRGVEVQVATEGEDTIVVHAIIEGAS